MANFYVQVEENGKPIDYDGPFSTMCEANRNKKDMKDLDKSLGYEHFHYRIVEELDVRLLGEAE